MQNFKFTAHKQAADLHQAFYLLTSIFLSHRNKDNVHFPILSTACGGKHALQLRFSAKPDSAFDENSPFSSGSKHGRLVRARSQNSLFRRSPTRQNLPPATFDASEHVLFCYFLHAAKSNRKTVLLVLFAKSKKNVKTALCGYSRKPNKGAQSESSDCAPVLCPEKS